VEPRPPGIAQIGSRHGREANPKILNGAGDKTRGGHHLSTDCALRRRSVVGRNSPESGPQPMDSARVCGVAQ
jgi:hypothetical protein